MSKEVMIGMLKVANNGNDILAILDSLVENEGDNITSDAVDFSGNPVNF
jgi:predicted transposase YbfD/YdcC